MPPSVLKGRKLLIASIGVAAVTYACNNEPHRALPVGNLMAPMPDDAGTFTTEVTDASAPMVGPAITTGNQLAPPPADAGPAKPDAGKKR